MGTSTRPDQLSTEKELSEYQQRAERLEFENKMLRAVLDSMPNNIFIKDLKGRYIFDNSGHARFLGATDSSEVVGKTVFDFLPTKMAAKFHAEDLRVLRSGESVVQSVDETVDRTGNKVWMSVRKMSLRDEKVGVSAPKIFTDFGREAALRFFAAKTVEPTETRLPVELIRRGSVRRLPSKT